MTKLSPTREQFPVFTELNLVNRGKVRDTYDLGNGLLLILASNAISIFDFVLNSTILQKGMILNAMSHFWFKLFEKHGIRHHMVAVGGAINEYLPDSLRGNETILTCGMVVKKLKMPPIEFIARGVLTGSSLTPYRETGKVCGVELPGGLQDGDKIEPVFTPTTKAAIGHDKHLDADKVRGDYPEETKLLLETFHIASDYAAGRGIMLADTKEEIGRDDQGNVVLADEVLTPDSSRFWSHDDWKTGRDKDERKAPPSLDKQFIRNWGITKGIRDLKTERSEDQDLVHSITVPEDLIEETTHLYRYIFWRLTGKRLGRYLREDMGISEDVVFKVAFDYIPTFCVVLGSKSDWSTIESVVLDAHKLTDRLDRVVRIISCHRNPQELRTFAECACDMNGIVLGYGGKAFAMPGVLDSWNHFYDNHVRVIGVGHGNFVTDSYEAARLSIFEIPGQPVIINEIDGDVYMGPEGLRKAIDRLINGELPPKKPRTSKPYEEINLELVEE
ncbi:MAG: phosphoribosylaminoimidazolesuccinocarboxamide synthase [Nanoarchaeota archaeon]|nr:phosphoribosylaminoimidazolesuccinocarboxamide synthase [Nanoarchaeota archaeon]